MVKLITSDRSKRTKAISRPFWVTVGMFTLIIVCSVWAIVGYFRYNAVIAASSTPMGTPLTFSASEAEMTLSGIYTDESDDVLIARLSLTDQAHGILPYQGSDYTVFVQSDALGGYEEIPILFGKMGTDGDMFLILPKPTNEVYTFAIVNPDGAYEIPDRLSRDDEDLAVDAEESVTSALSRLTTTQLDNGDTASDLGESASELGARHDIAGFRMTKKPAVNEPEYRPITIDEELYNADSGEFDFELFFKTVYVDAAVDRLTDNYNDLEVAQSQAEDAADRMEVRLNANPSDVQAAEQLADLKKQITSYETRKEDVAEQLTYYETLEYDAGIFDNFQNKAVVLNN